VVVGKILLVVNVRSMAFVTATAPVKLSTSILPK